MSGSKTTIDDDLLDNVHPGDILRDDFLIGSEIPLGEVADGTGLPEMTLQSLPESRSSIDAMIDLRLGRYFGMSEGFFLRLQNSYDIEQERRAHGVEIDKIEKRAA